jgi:hypothetical protein
MCYNSTEKTGFSGHSHCGCAGACPATLTVEEEIKLLEDHKNALQQRIEVLDRKIAALKAAEES